MYDVYICVFICLFVYLFFFEKNFLFLLNFINKEVAMKEVTVFSIFITIFIVAIGLWEIYYLREFFIYQKVA